MRYVTLNLAVLAALILGTAGRAFGGTISVAGDTGDGHVDVNGLPQDFSLTQLRVGVGGNDVRGLADIFLFALPNLPPGSSLLGADLQLQYLGITQGSPGNSVPPEFSVDLFGIGARSTPTILSTDYYDGNASLSTDALIAQGFVTPSTPTGSIQVSGSALLNFIASLYLPDGTPTAAYAVFRADPDVHLPSFSAGVLFGYEFASADDIDDGGAFVPQLILDVSDTPEPASITLLGLGIVCMVGFGRRRAKQAATA